MRCKAVLAHALPVLVALALLVGFPLALHPELFGSAAAAADGISSASLVLPEQPSGDFVVLINTALHPDTLADWQSFFRDEDFAVIFEDIDCLVATGDETARQLAERYQAQLPENQMRLRVENPTLLASKAEAGRFDVAVFSGEMAQALQLSPTAESTVILITPDGEGG